MDYWVITRDPSDEWMAVGDSEKDFVWILARNPHLTRNEVENITKQVRTTLGYTKAEFDERLIRAGL